MARGKLLVGPGSHATSPSSSARVMGSADVEAGAAFEPAGVRAEGRSRLTLNARSTRSREAAPPAFVVVGRMVMRLRTTRG